MKRKTKSGAQTVSTPETLRRLIIDTIRLTPRKLTPLALESALRGRLSVTRATVRAAVRDLVARGELFYTSHFGCSFLEPSFHRPVRISVRVVVKPPACRYAPNPNEIIVNLAAGAAFGSGEHPSTRLAVRGIEQLMMDGTWGGDRTRDTSVLDVGTGSGVLVIAAVLFGIQRGLGIDTDPCARSEARENVRLNRLHHRISISDDPADALSGPYSLITANLRYPSLARLAGCLAGMAEPCGGLVLSGVRPSEMPALAHLYTQKGFDCRWRDIEGGWGGMALCKSA